MIATVAAVAGLASNSYAQTSYQVLHSFDRPYSLGAYPSTGLIEGIDGSFYGTTGQGGTAVYGTIFKIDAQGTLTLLHSFNGVDGYPLSRLVQGSDGALFGLTSGSGSYGTTTYYGTFFKLDPGGTLTTLHRFTYGEGANPSDRIVKGSDGSFYGTTYQGGAAGYGTIFRIDSAGTLSTLYNFDSSDAYCTGSRSVIEGRDGNFYGTRACGGTTAYGTVFKLDPAGTLTTLHSFDLTEGSYPVGGLVLGTDGRFYGMTASGGAGGWGTIYSMDSAGTVTTLHNFDASEGSPSSGGLIQGTDGSFYGTISYGNSGSQGTVFKFDIGPTSTLTTLHRFNGDDGASPSGGLIQGSDGAFYGTTYFGGALASGTIFRLDAAGTLATLYAFGAREPRNPQAGLIEAADGGFLGTTFEGGSANRGTVFKMDSSGAVSFLHSFTSGEGANPQAKLIQANGSIYGTTNGNGGGSTGLGTIFKIDPAGTSTTIHTFDGSGGAYPYDAGLTQGSDGSFYGTTTGWSYGTVFKVDAAGTLTTLHRFDGTDGGAPSGGGLFLGNDGSLYGTTMYGGTAGFGTFFKLDPAGTLTTLHNFEEGGYTSRIVQGSDGSFYGTRSSGGTSWSGTLFRIDADGTLTTLHSFSYSEGAGPVGGLVKASDGCFYGMTVSGGARGAGTIFRADVNGRLTTLHDFTFVDGASAIGTLIQASDGSFYGVTSQGGANGSGVVFRLTVKMPTSTTLTASPSPSLAWQPVALTAIVTTDSGLPTGPVEFFDGLIHLGTASLDAGRAVLTTSALVIGSHALHAEYAGAATFAASNSPVVTQVVSLPAAFIYPSNGATNVDLTQPFVWTTVAGAQAYYLYVGSTPGAKDLVNTGEIQQTSYRVPLTLATGATFCARLWTKVGGTWRYVDVLFSAPPIARFTYPAATATTIDPTLPLTWTAVPAVQAYYLYIGSSPGAKDLVNTGEIQQTSYLVRITLPINQTLYARLWTKTGGVWRFTDRTFSALPALARFTYPAPGATTFDPRKPFAWTTVATAQAYYLYVGSSLGAKDVVNSGELSLTGYLQSVLPVDQPLYARLWTKAGGIWRYVDATFTVTAVTALHFTYPAAGAAWADMSQPFEWTPVATAQAYYLYVGTALGLGNLVDTGAIQTTSYLAANLPFNQPLYVRLWVKVGTAWSYIDRVITSIPSGATVIGFSGITTNGSAVTAYSESGFSITATSAAWAGITTYGQPTPFIDFTAPEGKTVAGEVRVSAGGATFTFNAVDLYSSTTPIPYTITGFRNSSAVFTLTGTIPNTSGAFRTVLNSNAAAIDSLSIVLTNAAASCCPNPMGLDNIVLTR